MNIDRSLCLLRMGFFYQQQIYNPRTCDFPDMTNKRP